MADHAERPDNNELRDKLAARLDFVRSAERLKDTLRSGFTSNGRTESVADHTWRLTLLAMSLFDLLPEVDPLRLLKICILHDLGEAVHGDIPAPLQDPTKPKAHDERKDFRGLIRGLPEEMQSEYLTLWDEYENASSHEGQVAKALDKLETILQHNQGKNPKGFDYAYNLEYGRSQTDAVPLAAALRQLLDACLLYTSDAADE